MTNTNTFDVLVVYANKVATSASSKKINNTDPFALAVGREHYSVAYAYFLKQCHNLGLTAAFTTSSDITGPGICKSYWEYKDKKWLKVNEFGFAPIIFDKFLPLRKSLQKKRKLLFADGISQPFSNKNLMSLFNDKLKTFKKLRDYTIPTVNITASTVINSIVKLEKLVSAHKNTTDFTGDFILKDRYGAGGINIFKIKAHQISEITQVLKSLPSVSFVLQPFAKFDRGFKFNNISGYTDIRIIYASEKVIQRYIRTAKANDFRCNEHQGGKVFYVKSNLIPKNIVNASNAILEILDNKNALFALDFIVSNNGNAYFLEGNISPGIYWGINSIEDKVNTKKLIRIIVKELKRRTDEYKTTVHEQEFFEAPVIIPFSPQFPLTTIV